MGQERCGKWMPRKKTACARTPGHIGPCKTAETMERNRLYNRDHPHRESPESRKKSNRKYRISSYGLTQKLFDLLLEAQQNACGMCHEPFEERQLIHVDHDHACCRGKNRSCGECIRGLLCHTCNVALGHQFGQVFRHSHSIAGTQREPKGSLGLWVEAQSAAAGVPKVPSAWPRTRSVTSVRSSARHGEAADSE